MDLIISSVLFQAFIIAFSSSFIPRLVYMMSVNPDKTDVNYVDHTLAYFNTKDFQEGTRPLYSAFGDVNTCRYAEYRNPPEADRPYKRPLVYWHILAARLAFIVVFQNIVYFVQMLVAWTVPDTPRKVRENVKREDFLTREIIIKEENQKTLKRRTLFRRQSEADMDRSPSPVAQSTENEVRKRRKLHGSGNSLREEEQLRNSVDGEEVLQSENTETNRN